jgi:hypothetical protein
LMTTLTYGLTRQGSLEDRCQRRREGGCKMRDRALVRRHDRSDGLWSHPLLERCRRQGGISGCGRVTW